MASEHILALLIAERDKLTAAIAALTQGVKRRGRPRKDLLEAGGHGDVPTPFVRKRRKMSAAGRKKIKEAQLKRWAKVRAAKSSKTK